MATLAAVAASPNAPISWILHFDQRGGRVEPQWSARNQPVDLSRLFRGRNEAHCGGLQGRG
jgi:hypothetical protein